MKANTKSVSEISILVVSVVLMLMISITSLLYRPQQVVAGFLITQHKEPCVCARLSDGQKVILLKRVWRAD